METVFDYLKRAQDYLNYGESKERFAEVVKEYHLADDFSQQLENDPEWVEMAKAEVFFFVDRTKKIRDPKILSMIPDYNPNFDPYLRILKLDSGTNAVFKIVVPYGFKI